MLFHTDVPRSTWILLRSNPPLHECFLRAKGYHCHSVDCCLQFFYGKLFFYFRLLSLAHSLLLHHITCFLPFAAFSLLLPVLHKDGRGVGTGEVGLSGELHCGSCQGKEYGLGMGTANPVKEPRSYSELCQAPQHCLTLFCISEFVLNQWTWRRFRIRSMVTVEMHNSSFSGISPILLLKTDKPLSKNCNDFFEVSGLNKRMKVRFFFWVWYSFLCKICAGFFLNPYSVFLTQLVIIFLVPGSCIL